MKMIENVARAIHQKRRNPDDGKHWFHQDADKCELTMQLAKAAIEAMREPTPEMLEVGDEAMTHTCFSQEVYSRIIDAALEEVHEND